MKLTNFQPTTTAHALLARHLERHQYKKGVYQGAAPADSSRRGKSHFRIERRYNGDLAVVFHHTDVLRASPDGTLTLRTGGYHDSQTTRAAFSHAVLSFTPWRMQLTTVTLNGYRNPCLIGRGLSDAVAFEEGMTIAPDGTVNNFGAQVSRYEADRQRRAAWRKDPLIQEFRELLPLMFEAAKSSASSETWRRIMPLGFANIYNRLEALQDKDSWADLIMWMAHVAPDLDAGRAWSALFDQPATARMRLVTPVTSA